MNDVTNAPKRAEALHLFTVVGERGLTWRELAAGTGGHHGQVSGMLSTLHRRGTIERVTEKRLRCGVYVLPEYVAGRPTVPFGTKLNLPEAVPYKQQEAEVHLELAMLRALTAAYEAELASRTAQTEAYRAWTADLEEQVADLALTLERRRRVARKELLKAVSEAQKEGEAAGWQTGYDEGVQAGRSETLGRDKADAIFAEGRAQGHREEQAAVDLLAAKLTEQVRAQVPIRTHHASCYVQHPECALKAIRRGIAYRRAQAA